MNSYEEKQAAKKERYEKRAARAQQASESHYTQAKRMGDAIPMGQPILVGHHSERGDRRYRGRMDNQMRKSVEADKKAAYLQEKADAVGTGGISSDDPDAIKKLEEKLAKLNKIQEKMKQANKLARKEDSAGLTAMGFTEAEVAELLKSDLRGRRGFPSFSLSNNNAKIKSTRERIKQLEASKEAVDKEIEGEGYTYREDTTENRVMFIFDGKPAAEVRQVLKANAFKWSPSRGAWVRQLTNPGKHAGAAVRQQLDTLNA
ncbi:DUF3560 domain-containing protein [Halomonas sp. 3D7M]|uniref:DUF3560 domain-containing protein n=1 Tax=Halomonas sp. 3D7M TaxID=2742617 RepID=UPI0018666892|nr:DUF3560 domain-containing protein [Halomonas sp. 3D7M]